MSVFVDTVKTLAGKSSTEVKVFSYKNTEDFRKLWGLDDSNNSLNDSITKRLKCWAKKYENRELTVVIVYDGMPQSTGDTISVGNFVGAHDWAMAASWSIYEDPCLQNLKLRILILDILYKSNNPSGKPFAPRSLFAFQNALPWIQDYRVVGSDQEAIVTAALDDTLGPDGLAWQRQALPPEYRDMEMLVKDLLAPERILTTYPADDLERKHYIELTRESWTQNLLKPGNRHSVANLVAPAILAFGLPNKFSQTALKHISQGSLMRRALFSTLREIDFLETSMPNPSNAINGLLAQIPSIKGGVFFSERLQNIRFVLVDDHFDLGYDHILGYTIFGEKWDNATETGGDLTYCGSLTTHENIEWLLKHLETLFSNPIRDWQQPRYLDAECDVLFLDLRLWEDKNRESRKTVIQKILCAANRLLGRTSPESVSREFKQAFDAAKNVCENPDQFSPEALTLLPLLLSHIDRTLPIVLFTSSHQRVVSEMLQDHPNVITSFVKPLISGYGETISPTDSVSDFENAIKKAIELHQARIAWKRICELKPTNACFDITDDATPSTQRCVQVDFSSRKDQLRPRLAELFETCVFGNVYESISLPWEFLEYEVAQCAYAHGYDKINPRGLRGTAATALKKTRNAKTHGDLNRDLFRDVKAKWVALLQLLFLLDFIEGTKERKGTKRENEKQLSESGYGPDDILLLLAKEVNFLTDRGDHSQNTFIQEETEKAIFSLIPC